MSKQQAQRMMDRGVQYFQQGQLNDALQACQQVLQLVPDSDAPVRLGLSVFVSGKRPDKGQAWLMPLLQKRPTAYRYAALLDLMRMNHEKRDPLLEVAERALQLYPVDPDVLLSAGVTLHLLGKTDRAIAAYSKRLEVLPNDAATKNNLAQLYRERGDLDQAIALWTVLLEQPDQNRPVLLSNLAQALQARGDKRKAEALFQQLIVEEPNNTAALRGLAELLADAGDTEQALPLANKALSVEPEHPRTWLIAAQLAKACGNPRESLRLLERGAAQARPALSVRLALFRLWLEQDQLPKAQEHAALWMQEEPKEVQYPLMLSDVAYTRSEFAEALAALQEAERRDWKQGGLALVRFYERREQLEDAAVQAKQMLERDPSIIMHYGLLSEVYHSQGRYEEALTVLDAGLAAEPFALILTEQKVRQLMVRERYAEAETVALDLIAHKPLPKHRALLLSVYTQSRQSDSAIIFCQRLVESEPDSLIYTLWLVDALEQARRLDDAATVCQQALAQNPDNQRLGLRLIQSFLRLERYDAAYATALQLQQSAGARPDSLVPLAVSLRDMGRAEDAIRLLEQGVASFPRHAGLRRELADTLRRDGRQEAELQVVMTAVRDFLPELSIGWAAPRVLRLLEAREGTKPALDTPEIQELLARINDWANRCPESLDPYWVQLSMAQRLDRMGDVFHTLDVIAKRQPDNLQLLWERANAHSKCWNLTESIACHRQLCALRPTSVLYTQGLLDELIKAGNYEEFDTLIDRIKHLLGDRRYSYYRNLFFNCNCHPTWTAEQVYTIFKDWYERSVMPKLPPVMPHKNTRDPERRLKIGYVSPDFRRHAMAYYAEPMLMEHDRTQFEIHAFVNLENSDAYTERFKGYVDHWHDVTYVSDDELEKMIREQQIDILIDLAGHTSNNRLAVFARKPAPVQAGWIYGYIQTTGLREIDYLLCDGFEVPVDHERYLAEPKVMRLSFGGHPYKPAHDFLEPEPLPCLSNGFVTFGVTTRPLRVNKQCMEAWSAILHRLPTAKLCFSNVPYKEQDIQQRFTKSFAELGIAEERLLFCNIKPYWKAYSQIDLQLDCFPVGSGTTLSEGLWMERVSLCVTGRPPMGRVAYGTQQTLGLAPWVCADSIDDYIEKGVYLGEHPEKLVEISSGLRERMQHSKLMDYTKYGQEIAAMYRTMWRNYCGQ